VVAENPNGLAPGASVTAGAAAGGGSGAATPAFSGVLMTFERSAAGTTAAPSPLPPLRSVTAEGPELRTLARSRASVRTMFAVATLPRAPDPSDERRGPDGAAARASGTGSGTESAATASGRSPAAGLAGTPAAAGCAPVSGVNITTGGSAIRVTAPTSPVVWAAGTAGFERAGGDKVAAVVPPRSAPASRTDATATVEPSRVKRTVICGRAAVTSPLSAGPLIGTSG
jgi:hypothetical protein